MSLYPFRLFFSSFSLFLFFIVLFFIVLLPSLLLNSLFFVFLFSSFLFFVFHLSSFIFSPSLLIIISRYKKSILLPSIRGGESSPKGCAGEGLFFFPIPINYNQPLQEWHFTPLSNGEGKAAQRAARGRGFLFRLHIPRRILIRRLIALCHHRDERHDEAEEARHEIYPPCEADAVRIG